MTMSTIKLLIWINSKRKIHIQYIDGSIHNILVVIKLPYQIDLEKYGRELSDIEYPNVISSAIHALFKRM